jgi:uncharacterized protein YcfL
MRNAIAIMALLLVVGCASFQATSGKILATSAITVDASMKGWAIWVAKGQATDAQQAAVKSAYQKYQAAISIATGAYETAVTTGDQTAWKQAEIILTNNQTALVNLISQFSKPQ